MFVDTGKSVRGGREYFASINKRRVSLGNDSEETRVYSGGVRDTSNLIGAFPRPIKPRLKSKLCIVLGSQQKGKGSQGREEG